jgi:hypothetical protein
MEKWGEWRETLHYWEGCTESFPAFRSFTQCPIVHLVEVYWREGKALRGEEGKDLGSGICYEQRKEAEQRFYCA